MHSSRAASGTEDNGERHLLPAAERQINVGCSPPHHDLFVWTLACCKAGDQQVLDEQIRDLNPLASALLSVTETGGAHGLGGGKAQVPDRSCRDMTHLAHSCVNFTQCPESYAPCVLSTENQQLMERLDATNRSYTKV